MLEYWYWSKFIWHHISRHSILWHYERIWNCPYIYIAELLCKWWLIRDRVYIDEAKSSEGTGQRRAYEQADIEDLRIGRRCSFILRTCCSRCRTQNSTGVKDCPMAVSSIPAVLFIGHYELRSYICWRQIYSVTIGGVESILDCRAMAGFVACL